MNVRSLFLLTVIILFSFNGFSQAYKISYSEYQNGIKNEKAIIEMYFSDGIAYLTSGNDQIKNFIDYKRENNVSMITYEESNYRLNTAFDELSKGIDSTKIDSLLGFYCKHKYYNYFSNSIDVFYTLKSPAKGSPYKNFIPSSDALVLKIIINGNRELIADKIEAIALTELPDYPYDEAVEISASEFEEFKIKSRYTSMNVFEEEIINFDTALPKTPIEDLVNGKTYRLSNGTIILKKIRLPEMASKGAYTYVKLSCRSNGDAYDRTGSVFAIVPNDRKSMMDAFRDSIEVLPSFLDNNGKKYHAFRLEPNFHPALEWMRFFTSFGVDHFNDKRVINNYPWKKTATYKQDISSLIPSEAQEIWVGVFVGNYHKGGHIVSLDLEFFPSFESEKQNEQWLLPLFNTVNIMEMSGQQYPRLFNNDTLEIEFELPDKLEELQMLFTTTGHGGWGGGDEFNPRLNRIFIDGKQVFEIVPWRTDCAKFRLYNPASGNFANGMSSSDFSRSNWCPATSTPPYYIPLNELQAGKHKMSIIIDQGEDEGSSFNAWSISGVLTANKSFAN